MGIDEKRQWVSVFLVVRSGEPPERGRERRVRVEGVEPNGLPRVSTEEHAGQDTELPEERQDLVRQSTAIRCSRVLHEEVALVVPKNRPPKLVQRQSHRADAVLDHEDLACRPYAGYPVASVHWVPPLVSLIRGQVVRLLQAY